MENISKEAAEARNHEEKNKLLILKNTAKKF